MILTTSEESRLLDQRAMTEYGLPESVLMENAGASVVQLMKEKISWEDARWLSSAAAEITGVTDSSRHGTLFPKVLMWRFLSWGMHPIWERILYCIKI